MFCQSGLPLLAFVGCAVMVVWLWNSNTTGTGTVGEFFARRADIMPIVAGELTPTYRIQEFQEVRKGEVIAELDPKALDARIAVLNAEAEALKAQLNEVIASARFEDQSAVAQHAADIAQIRSDAAGLTVRYLEAWQEYSVAEIEYKRNKDLYEAYAKVADINVDFGSDPNDPSDDKVVSRDDDGERSQRIVSIAEMLVVIRDMQAAQKTYNTAKYRFDAIKRAGGDIGDIIKKLPPPPKTDVAALLAPVEKEMIAKLAEADEIRVQKEQFKIRAPFDGVVTAVYAQPNQVVQPGTPICTIASTKVEYVLAYVRQNSILRPRVGMKATVRFRGSKETVSGAIVKVGAQVEAVSLKQLVDPQMQEWGLPIAIELDWNSEQQLREVQPRPGEIVFVQVDPYTTDEAVVARASADIHVSGGQIVFAGK